MSRLTRLVGRVGRKLKTLVPEAPPPEGVPLTVVEEAQTLVRVADPLAGAPNVIGPVVEAAILGDAEARASLEGKSGGVDVPGWADGAGGALRSAVDLARVKDVWHAPAFGAVFDDAGQVFRSTVHEALYLTPTLAALPHTRREGEVTVFSAPAEAPIIPRATVFMAWGGLHNYGHFLIDCLPALLAAEHAGALEAFPAVSPPLLPWQAELLTLLLGADAPMPTVIDAPVARLDEAVFATPMDHFLHAPGPPLDAVRERILAAAAVPYDPGAPKRIYVSRLGSLKRVLVNEAELEAALEARGFMIVRPEAWSIRDQIALFNRADVVVAPAGAAMANILFCKPGTKVFEIQPSNFIGVWVRNIALLVGVDWRAFFAPSPLSETEIVMEGELRPASEFRWRLDLPGFLTFLDGGL
ncbi:glycosyltransferase 61 family protein [Caulobacter sp. 1776]|uniref:glycosyltransferase family 61 protein n=1 Tax=Caulobacter sp. 1776 TaxID=3156420 RepID=UPI0033917179